MRALIEGLVYLVVAVLYLAVQVIRALASAMVELIRALASAVRPSRTEARPASVQGPAEQSRGEARAQPATGPPRTRRTKGAGRRWKPEHGAQIAQMPLFGADAPLATDKTSAAPRKTRSRGGGLRSPPTTEVRAAEPAASPAPHRGATREEPRRFDAKARWVGKLVARGIGQFVDTKRQGGGPEPAKYSSYYVTLETEEGAIVTKQGVELQKALELCGAEIGDMVELLLLGKEAVNVTEGGRAVVRHRNKWRINRKQENQWHR